MRILIGTFEIGSNLRVREPCVSGQHLLLGGDLALRVVLGRRSRPVPRELVRACSGRENMEVVGEPRAEAID